MKSDVLESKSALCNTAGLFICKEKCRVFFFMGNDSEMPLPISAARKVSLCVRLAGTDKRRVSEWWRKCRPSLPALTDLRPETDVSHPGLTRAFGYRWNPRRPVCQRGGWRSVRKKGVCPLQTRRGAIPCRVRWQMQTGEKEEGFNSPDWQRCCGWTGESAVEVSCFWPAEWTFVITDGHNEALSTFQRRDTSTPLKQLR